MKKIKLSTINHSFDKLRINSLIMLLALPVMMRAQTEVRGTIVDAATGEPMSGITVSCTGGMTALSDSAGAYKLIVPTLNGTSIIVNASGYNELCLPLQGRSEVDVRMYATMPEASSHSMALDEDLGATRGGDLRAISRGGEQGIGANLFIRGYNTINLNAQPLIIVDGVVMNFDGVESVFAGFYIDQLAAIDVNDIESIQVMKNASSIYGSKGANGAVVITTKRGKSISTRLTLNMNWGVSFAPKTMKTMDDAQFRSFASEMMKGAGNGLYNADRFEGFLNDETDPAKNIAYNSFHNNHDWNDDVWQTAFRQYYGLQCEGGDEIAKYALSVSYMMGKGNVKTSDHNRLNAHFNADVLLHRRLSLAAGLDFTHISRTLLDAQTGMTTSPTFLAMIKSPLLLPYKYTDDGQGYTANLADVDVFGVSNPQSMIDNSKNSFTQYRFGVNMMPRWKVTDWMDISTRFAYNMNATKEHYYSPVEGVAPVVMDNGTVIENTVKDQSINQNAIYSDTKVHAEKLFAYRHSLDMSLGVRIQSNTYKNNYGEGHNTGSDKITNLSTSLDNEAVDGRKTTVRNAAAYLEGRYRYLNKYGAWFVLETEACSTFGDNVSEGFRMMNGTWAVFPSGGIDWNVSSEKFMSALPWVNRLNVRADYGVTGNDGIDVLQRYAYMKAVNWFGAANGLQIGNLKNSSLKWEQTRKFGLGADLAILNDRVRLGFDWYRNKTTDLLMAVAPSKLTGLDAYLMNFGTLTNTGYEINLGARVLNLKRFRWDAQIGMAHYRNELTSLSEQKILEAGRGYVVLQEGAAIGAFYGYQTSGDNPVFATEAEAKAAGLKTWNENKSQLLAYHAGDIYFVDRNADGIIDEKDMGIIGDANPDLTGSIQNHFAYKQFALDILMTFSLGGDIYNYQRHELESMAGFYNQTVSVTNRWKSEGQQTATPRAVYGDPMGNSRFSDRFIEDGSYLKVREIRLTYNPTVRRSFLQRLELWASVTNVYTFTKYLGADPEVSASVSPIYQGIDFGVPTAGRGVYLGVKVDL